ncbi:septal ring lytic transglycosylase RlpA family protein [Rhodohalobacter sp. SW132]|uniref:septal ring lytic transglycosylase RlpA family protein n=1 Tax=Rhodohalobacter sp. SW132 TaxID=2293433 RepID=UPI001315A451|nr:septal ring lytic transglycosylase RlpA family protein [Rhodohalobacter sp. SW132]
MEKRLHIFFLFPVLILLVFAGCYEHPMQQRIDQQTSDEESAEVTGQSDILQTGEASWYGPGFHGRLTSNRERFNQNDLTAAHRTLPFNTIVEVVNTENNETIEVRINDRGPYARNRVIDLSRAAADEIGMIDEGVADVELVLVEAGGPIPENLNRPTFTIQLGEYNLASYAGRFADEVGDGVRVEQRFPRGSVRTVYMIYYGNYTSMSSANADLEQLRERGFDGFVRQID